MEVTSDGKRETQVIRAEGEKPFRTIGWRRPKNEVTYGRDATKQHVIEVDP